MSAAQAGSVVEERRVGTVDDHVDVPKANEWLPSSLRMLVVSIEDGPPVSCELCLPTS